MKRIVAAIEADLRDRHGFGFGSFTDDTQDEIRDQWVELARSMIESERNR
jgi:hypothetical protein